MLQAVGLIAAQIWASTEKVRVSSSDWNKKMKNKKALADAAAKILQKTASSNGIVKEFVEKRLQELIMTSSPAY